MKKNTIYLLFVTLVIFLSLGSGHLRAADFQSEGIPDTYSQVTDGYLHFIQQACGAAISAAISGDYLYTGVGLRMKVFDISNPMEPEEVWSSAVLDGWVMHVSVSGDVLYLLGEFGMKAFSLADPASPLELGSVVVYGSNMAVSGNYAYLANRSNGINIVDVTDPTNMSLVANSPAPQDIFGLAAQGNYIYAADQRYGLQILDVSDPHQPQVISLTDFPGYERDLKITGNYAYLTTAHAGLRIIDISNPALPLEVGFYDFGSNGYDITLTGTHALLADLYYGLIIVDVSDPMHPFETGRVETTGQAHTVVAGDDTAFIADWGLAVIDTQDLANPHVDHYAVPNGLINEVTVKDHYAYMGQYYVLLVMDISNPRSPNLVKQLDVPVSDLKIVGDDLYVAGGENLSVFDISEPANPVLLGSHEWLYQGDVDHVVIQGNLAFVTTTSLIHIVDVSDPTNMVVLSSTPAGYDTEYLAIAVKDNYAYIAVYSYYYGSKLGVLDISDPANPTLVNDIDGLFYSLSILDDLLYASTYGGFIIYDLADPADPQEMGSLDVGFDVGEVNKMDEVALVPAYEEGLLLVDVSDKTQPELLETHATTRAHKAIPNGNEVYLADGRAGLLIFSRNEPTEVYLPVMQN